MIPVYLDEQLVNGTFEHTLSELIDTQMDLSIFDRKYNNDVTGAKAIEPHCTTMSNFVSGMAEK